MVDRPALTPKSDRPALTPESVLSRLEWRVIRRLDGLRTKLGLSYEIIGVGGVMTVEDFQEYREAGADIVQSATGAMWNPDLAIDIKNSGL